MVAGDLRAVGRFLSYKATMHICIYITPEEWQSIQDGDQAMKHKLLAVSKQGTMQIITKDEDGILTDVELEDRCPMQCSIVEREPALLAVSKAICIANQ